MGSGRVGVAIASALDADGHSVAIIDTSSEAFRKLPAAFGGQKIKGLGFDRDTLIKAGIEQAYAFAAVANGDNSNIIAARIAREKFGVEHVVARIYDPRRADVYKKLGIPTTSPVRWTANEMLRHLLPPDCALQHYDNRFDVDLLQIIPAKEWLGVPIQAVEKNLDLKVAYIGRDSQPYFNLSQQVIQENDELYCTVAHQRAAAIRSAFINPPQLEELN